MKHSFLICLTFFLILVVSVAQTPAQTQINKALQRELIRLGNADQKDRDEWMRMMGTVSGSSSAKEKRSLELMTKKMMAVDAENIRSLEKIIRKYGWPTIGLVGKKANQAAFLIVQHAETKIQKKYFPLLKKAAQNKEADPAEVAMMEDRILMADGKKQIYGTQLQKSSDAKEWVVYPIADEANLDARRTSVGLPPMKIYLEEFAKTFGPIRNYPENNK